jgi:hypothetical protein
LALLFGGGVPSYHLGQSRRYHLRRESTMTDTIEEELQVIQQDHDRVVRAHGVPKRVPGVKRNHTHSTPWRRGSRGTEVKAA